MKIILSLCALGTILLLLKIFVSFTYTLKTKPYKIRVIERDTNNSIENICLYHTIIYNAYSTGFGGCGKGWFQIVVNQYCSDQDGIIEIPESEIFIKRVFESKHLTGESLIINIDTKNKFTENDYKVIRPKRRSINFNQLHSKYRLIWDEFDSFSKINPDYSSLVFNIDYNITPDREEDYSENVQKLKKIYSEHGMNYEAMIGPDLKQDTAVNIYLEKL